MTKLPITKEAPNPRSQNALHIGTGFFHRAFWRFCGGFWLESSVEGRDDVDLTDMPLQRYNLNIFTKGWFVGNFSPTLIASDAVEVAVKHYKAGEAEKSALSQGGDGVDAGGVRPGVTERRVKWGRER